MKSKKAHIEKVLSAIHGTNQNPDFLLDTGIVIYAQTPTSEEERAEISISGEEFGEALFWIYSNPEEGKIAKLFKEIVDFTWSKDTLNQTEEFKFWQIRNVVDSMFEGLEETLHGSYLQGQLDPF